ncbi:MAG TPA: MarR family transcriptional regulator, partial [Candidatus Angelobacter sp.]|nr:MarR family transcriptional regulator [Candidatus Angelobacter sp.]
MNRTAARYDAPFIARLYLPRVVAEGFAMQDRALAPIGLTTRQALILLSCDLGEAGTAAEMAALYGLEVSSITRLVDRLEKKRLIERTRSRVDRRKSMLSLTPGGKAALKEAVKIATPKAVAMWKGVSEKERRMLAAIVEKVLKNLNEMGPSNKSELLKAREMSG